MTHNGEQIHLVSRYADNARKIGNFALDGQEKTMWPVKNSRAQIDELLDFGLEIIIANFFASISRTNPTVVHGKLSPWLLKLFQKTVDHPMFKKKKHKLIVMPQACALFILALNDEVLRAGLITFKINC